MRPIFKLLGTIVCILGGLFLISLVEMFFVFAGGIFLFVGLIHLGHLFANSRYACRFGFHRWGATGYADRQATGYNFRCQRCNLGAHSLDDFT